MIDKVSEDLLGVLPDDLPFKEDEILGMLSGTQDNEGVYHTVKYSLVFIDSKLFFSYEKLFCL